MWSNAVICWGFSVCQNLFHQTEWSKEQRAEKGIFGLVVAFILLSFTSNIKTAPVN